MTPCITFVAPCNLRRVPGTRSGLAHGLALYGECRKGRPFKYPKGDGVGEGSVKGLLVSQLFAVAEDLCAVAVLEYRGLV